MALVDRIVAGMEGKPLTDGKAKSLVAYHEVGHAVCGTLTPGHDAVQKVCARARAALTRLCMLHLLCMLCYCCDSLQPALHYVGSHIPMM